MKKILLLGPFPIGDKGLNGQTIANQTLYEGLKKDYLVEYINTSRELEFNNKREQGKFKLGKFFKIFIFLIKEIFHILFSKYDVIYMTPGQSFLGFMRFSPYMILSFIKGVPCFIHIHGGNFRNMYDNLSFNKKKVLKFFLKRITGVIVLGGSLKKMFKGLVKENKIFICENGVQDFVVATEKEIKNKLERITRSKKRKIIYLSNLMKEKGILEVLKVSEKFSEDDIEFNLAGAIEPEIKNEVREYLKKYPNKIIYHGVVSGQNKKELLLNNDIFILPSWDEGQPISILEAYVTGCSVITDENVGGIGDIFQDKVNGNSCKAKNIDSIFEAIEKVKNNDKYIKDNYQYGIENYTKEKFVSRIKNIILGE